MGPALPTSLDKLSILKCRETPADQIWFGIRTAQTLLKARAFYGNFRITRLQPYERGNIYLAVHSYVTPRKLSHRWETLFGGISLCLATAYPF